MQGSKSFSATRYDEDKLVELRETQQTHVVSNGTLLDERAIVNEVFGERRGHVCGVGLVLKGTSYSLDSTAASKDHMELPISSLETPRMTILDLLCMRLSYAECS
ncbi:hypothetical protein Adt_27765 [Abeliophyllum distichum]|uniref:Uncharacterized protein n=1 Tax=Abeliophyllum distichum TaxID=126358 RepID=A0ABD1RUQ0_9LAMI